MTFHSPIASSHGADDPVACLHQMIEVTIDFADSLALPGAIGAHLDHALALLRRHAGMPEPEAALLAA